jgi:hypothetical protein
MIQFTRPALFASLALAVSGLGQSVRADFMSDSGNIPMQTTDFTASTSVAKFNSALGTLTKVEVSITVNGSFAGTVTNTANGAQNFNVTELVKLTLTGPNTLSLKPTLTASQTYSGLMPGVTSAFGPYSPTSTSTLSPAYTSAADLAAFLGTGNVNFSLSTMTGTTISGGGGNILAAIATSAGGMITVNYTFTPTGVPEPASVVLMGIGGVTLLGLGQRRRMLARTI